MQESNSHLKLLPPQKRKRNHSRRVISCWQKGYYEYFMCSLLLQFKVASFILDNSETLLFICSQWRIMYHLSSYWNAVKVRSEYILIKLLSSSLEIFVKLLIASHLITKLISMSHMAELALPLFITVWVMYAQSLRTLFKLSNWKITHAYLTSDCTVEESK